jgi:hypothetical protein
MENVKTYWIVVAGAQAGAGAVVWSGNYPPEEDDIKEAWDVVSNDSSLWGASLWDVELELRVDGEFIRSL